VFGGSQHHPLVLVGAAIFIVGILYFVFIKNPQLLNRLLGRSGGFVGASVGAKVPGPNEYPDTYRYHIQILL
jgi:hypothetical protein